MLRKLRTKGKMYDVLADLERSYGKGTTAYKMISDALNSSPEVNKILTDNILALKKVLATSNNYLAKALAAYVRYHIEEFHSKHLSDEQMRELNPLIRNAIFTMLEDISEERYFKISGLLRLNLPDYWEDCEYIDK